MLRSLFIIIIMTAGIVAALFSRFAALLVYIWFALFRPQEWLWVDITALHLSLVLGVLLVVPSLATGVFPDLSHPLSIGAILFLISALMAQFQAVNAAIGWEWIDYLSRLILVALIATTLISTRRRFVLALTVVAISIGFHSAKAGLASLIGGGVQFAAGQAGAFIDNNGYALAMAMILPLLWFAGQMVPREFPDFKWAARGFFLAVPLSAFAIISTFSRAGFLALSAVVLSVRNPAEASRPDAPGVGAGARRRCAFCPHSEGLLRSSSDDSNGTRKVQDDSALSRRWDFWQVAVQMAEANPFGVGLRNFDSVYDK